MKNTVNKLRNGILEFGDMLYNILQREYRCPRCKRKGFLEYSSISSSIYCRNCHYESENINHFQTKKVKQIIIKNPEIQEAIKKLVKSFHSFERMLFLYVFEKLRNYKCPRCNFQFMELDFNEKVIFCPECFYEIKKLYNSNIKTNKTKYLIV
ncbi:MAG: hypothetical protein ACFFAH_03670 [Promethearchaeota archaeon]